MEEDNKPQQKKNRKFVPEKAWKPGQSGNPNGRPKADETFTSLLKQYGETTIITDDDERKTLKQALIEKMWQMSLNGNDKLIMYLNNRFDGTPRQEVTVRSENTNINTELDLTPEEQEAYKKRVSDMFGKETIE
jgi:hypothetical protein